MTQPALRIWLISDGRAGIENQGLGLYKALEALTPCVLETKRVSFHAVFDRLPTFMKLWPRLMVTRGSARFTPPYPDICICVGRASLPFSLRFKKWSGGKSFVVQIQDPKHPAHLFDCVIAPEHDGVRGENVISMIGAPSKLSALDLFEAYQSFAPSLNKLPRPHIGVLIGGPSKVYDFGLTEAKTLCARLKNLQTQSQGALLVTVSRRTPKDVRALIRTELSGHTTAFYDGDGPNPYLAYLYSADYLIVTSDSVNMACDAAFSAKPVSIYPLPVKRKGPTKFDQFHQSLIALGITKPLQDKLEDWAYASFDETSRVAKVLLARFIAHQNQSN